jgi:hypothetical protein
LLKHLFCRQYLVNDYMTMLLTGRTVDLPYYNPHLTILKDKIRKSDFCSAIDYSGGEGPVVITRLLKILNE